MSPQNPDIEPIARLGPFDLIGFLGRGAMGQVWRAYHREQDVSAAIKIITEEQAQREDYHHQFRHEVRAVAGLSHPGIVMVFDYGGVTDELEEATFGELRAGSPCLAMELCPKGSLNNLEERLSFANVRSILLSLLDALAHAHARGVIHRDLKPANILLGDDTDWTGVKLTDFGLAFVPERIEGDDASRRGACGTPAYMSPEQLLGKWRDIGPWSDLYSLGCLAYQLVNGRPPYLGNSIVQVAKMHLGKSIPALDPRIKIPAAFEGWVRRLLQKDARDRFRNAADAAWELLLMGPGEPLAPRSDAESSSFSQRDSTFVLKSFEKLLSSTDPGKRLLSSMDELEATNAQMAKDPTNTTVVPQGAPLPVDWQHLISRRPSLQLLGAGLGLYGLRHIPLVGRSAERDLMWRQLREVVEHSTPRAVLLRGAAGTGKSYLAQWLCERAQETGAAICLEASHSPSPGGSEGLAKMLARHFRTAGLERAEILARLQSWLVARGVDDPYAFDALTEIIRPATDADVAAGQRKIRFGSTTQRYAMIARVLELICKERAVIIWLDDLQWATDSLGFLRHTLDSEDCEDLPVLFVGTLREDVLPDESSVRSELAKFALDAKVEHLSLGPLSTDAQAELIEKLLYLAPSLARTVADRTEGNPLFAVQLIGDWVDRGVLEVAGEGFVLADGEEALIPDDLFDVWSSRLDEVLSDAGEGAIRALELAAILGLDVDESEWRACLALGDCEFPSDAVQDLLSHRLFEDTDTGVRFVHSMLRESLERRAGEDGRLIEHNRVCARMLSERYDAEPRLAERLGRHLLAARAYLDALEPLLEGAKARGNAAEFDASLVLLDLRLDAIEALELPEICAPRVATWALRALIAANCREAEEAEMLARRAVDAAKELDDDCLTARCLLRLAQCHQHQGDRQSVLTLLDQARQLALEGCCGDQLLVHIDEIAGVSLAYMGEVEEAIERLKSARQLAIELDDVTRQVVITRELGGCERRRGNLAKAESILREALILCDKVGLQLRVGDTLLSLADVVRLRGRLGEAEALYRKVLVHGRSGRRDIAELAQLNLALVCMQREQFSEARLISQELRPTFERSNQGVWLLFVDAISLSCLAHEADWPTFNNRLDAVLEKIEQHSIVDADMAICFEQCAKIAAKKGRYDEAVPAFEAALKQWEQSGNNEKARAMRRELDRITALST